MTNLLTYIIRLFYLTILFSLLSPTPIADMKTVLTFNAEIDHLRLQYYSISNKQLAMDIPISLERLQTGIVGMCIYLPGLPIQRISINTYWYTRLSDVELQAVVFHELTHCVYRRPNHIDGEVTMPNGYACPIMSTRMWDDYQYEHCYKKYIDLYFKALIEDKKVDKYFD